MRLPFHKFMLAIETPDRKLWPQAALDTGTFDWKRAVFTTKIPADATAVTLVLEQVTGKFSFDNRDIGPDITGYRLPTSTEPRDGDPAGLAVQVDVPTAPLHHRRGQKDHTHRDQQHGQSDHDARRIREIA